MFLNRTTVIGFTGQESKTFATQSGKEITRLSVATTRRYQQGSEWKEKTQWHDRVFYGGAAQYAANFPKGTHVLIEGEWTHREYSRTVESESGPVNVQWPVPRLSLNRSRFSIGREKNRTRWREPLSGSLLRFSCCPIADVNGV
jgi:single stranded DNA-binding protein